MFLARPQTPGEGRALAVKDLFDTAGLVTTYGSAIYAEHVPKRTAQAVLRLEAGGWANVGKANLHEFAWGITSQNPHYGTVPNPVAPGRVAGGSSGGCAAALATGLCEGALGTDSGGSIRIPAAWCGVVGLKPSFGLVPIDGCFPLAPSFDHAGPMARDVATCAELMRALAPGFEPIALDSLAELRIAVVAGAGPPLAGSEAVELPSGRDLAGAFMREVAEIHKPIFAEHSELYGANVRFKVERSLALPDDVHERSLRSRERIVGEIDALLDRYELLIAPTVGFGPPPDDVDELDVRKAAISLTIPFNAAGTPALALPFGRRADGTVDSIQIVGARGADALVLAAGELVERAAG